MPLASAPAHTPRRAVLAPRRSRSASFPAGHRWRGTGESPASSNRARAAGKQPPGQCHRRVSSTQRSAVLSSSGHDGSRERDDGA